MHFGHCSEPLAKRKHDLMIAGPNAGQPLRLAWLAEVAAALPLVLAVPRCFVVRVPGGELAYRPEPPVG